MCEGLVLRARVWFRVRGSGSVCKGLVRGLGVITLRVSELIHTCITV